MSITVVAVICALVGAMASGVLAQGNHEQTAERFVLTGVMFLGGGSGVAWLQEPSFTGDRPVALRAGDRIGSYRLTRVLEDRVELEGPKGSVLVPLRNAAGAPATAVASAGPGVSTPAGSEVPAAVPPARSEAPLAMQPQTAGAPPRSEAPIMQSPRHSQQAKTQPAQGQQPAGVAQSGGPAVTNPSGNVPNVIFIRPGDPLRGQTFQSIIGVGK